MSIPICNEEIYVSTVAPISEHNLRLQAILHIDESAELTFRIDFWINDELTDIVQVISDEKWKEITAKYPWAESGADIIAHLIIESFARAIEINPTVVAYTALEKFTSDRHVIEIRFVFTKPPDIEMFVNLPHSYEDFLSDVLYHLTTCLDWETVA